MKEKISRNKISRHYKSFFGLEDMGLAVNDNLMIDWGESLINELVNQEVEKRIAERMPSEEEINLYADWHSRKYEDDATQKSIAFTACRRAIKWLRSRLTCSEKPNNLKTEGGGE